MDYLISEDKGFTAQDGSTKELHRRLNVVLTGTIHREVLGLRSEALENIRHRTWGDMPEADEMGE